jgi:phage terminase large subunit-like protein
MGRRWGKTVLGGTTASACAARGARVAWVVPTYKNGRPLWRWADRVVQPLKRERLIAVNQSERTMEFRGGGGVAIYSMDNPDSILGEAFHLVIIDEAARIAETVWTDAIMPTLADHGGRAILISTPKGKNWFWQEWLRGQEDREDVKSWQAPTADNPNPRIKRAAELVRDRVPERTYRQEWLAEFVEDGSVFRYVREAAHDDKGLPVPMQSAPTDGHAYVIGCDWGKVEDYTVFAVVDATARRLAFLDRSNKVDYAVQRGRLMALCERWKPGVVIAEANSMGMPIIEALARDRVPVRPFTTTNATKAAIIDGLALAFERREVVIPNHPTLIGELQAYEATKTALGLPKYSAPEGMHDDCVMGLALAWSGLGRANSAVGAFG